MNLDPTTQLRLLRIQSLIADKNLEVALANRETALDGWLSDHKANCAQLDREIEFIKEEIVKYL